MSYYDLSGRVVVITGSTGGLGSAIAKSLHYKGAKLALLDLDIQAASAQAKTFGGSDIAEAWEVDVCSFESLETAMAAAAKHFGRIDVVIANAGIEIVAPMATLSPKSFDSLIDINLNGVWRTFKTGLPYVQQQKGYLMAISSMAAFVHSPLQSAYTASKAGVWAMCDSIRLELKHLGVGVGSVHPTFFKTPMVDQMHADPAARKLWGGNEGGLWKMVTIDAVVDGIIQGIEQRKDMIVVPRQNLPIANAPGMFRKIIEKLGFKQHDVVEAIALSDMSNKH